MVVVITLSFCCHLSCFYVFLCFCLQLHAVLSTAETTHDAAQQTKIFNITQSAKYVVVLSYQRCGSSFVGEIFNRNPYAFYAFEPLDSLYTALYGTTPGWNVPSDITSNKDGTVR